MGLGCISQTHGQGMIKATLTYDSSGVYMPVAGIKVTVLPENKETYTDEKGRFTFKHLGKSDDKSMLIFHYANNSSDTLFFIPARDKPDFIASDKYLVSIRRMSTANIIRPRVASSINSRGIQKIEILNEEEFKKAACCTLSESFEANNTVEVSNADGVSGIRQVEMLGLAGKYVLMTRDNIPVIRGLNVLTGLNQIPGPMVSGVHIAKGAGPVTAGFEGLTGGLNYALKAEPKDPKLFVNGYFNSQMRAEGNVIVNSKIDSRTNNYTYLYYGSQLKTHDQGGDGFTDIPLYKRIYVGNQIRHHGRKAEGQLGMSYMQDNREGGDIHNFHHPSTTQLRFKFNMEETRAEVFGKLGIFLNEDGSKSIGNIFSVSRNTSDAVLNNLINRRYHGEQNSLNYTGLYGSPDERKWSTKIGVNVNYDEVKEVLQDIEIGIYRPQRKELSIGAFHELVFKNERMTWLMGNRLDRNNIYGLLYTPRLHFKYDINKLQQLHLQAGLGRRTPWILAENLPWLINNRSIVTTQITGNTPEAFYIGAYSMPQELAWNAGASYTLHGMAFGFPATVSLDAYYTYFEQQIVVDRDRDPSLLIIEAQQGNQTTLGQIDVTFIPLRRMEVKLSYRYVNSQQNLGYKEQIQAMQSQHRGLVVLNYQTRNKWYFDGIGQFNSPKRLPSTIQLPEEQQKETHSPAYVILNLQIRKNLKSWEFYAGAENLLNVRQNQPYLNTVVGNTQYFDAAFAWGPTMGRNFYAGFRFSLK